MSFKYYKQFGSRHNGLKYIKIVSCKLILF